MTFLQERGVQFIVIDRADCADWEYWQSTEYLDQDPRVELVRRISGSRHDASLYRIRPHAESELKIENGKLRILDSQFSISDPSSISPVPAPPLDLRRSGRRKMKTPARPATKPATCAQNAMPPWFAGGVRNRAGAAEQLHQEPEAEEEDGRDLDDLDEDEERDQRQHARVRVEHEVARPSRRRSRRWRQSSGTYESGLTSVCARPASGAAQQVEDQVAAVPHPVLDVVAEDPQVPHVADRCGASRRAGTSTRRASARRTRPARCRTRGGSAGATARAATARTRTPGR